MTKAEQTQKMPPPFAPNDIKRLTADVPPGSFAAIAFNVDRVVAVGPDPEAVRAEARAKGEKRPILYLVPDPEELRMPRV